jgi:hypothetical protein
MRSPHCSAWIPGERSELLHVFDAPRGDFIDNALLAFSPDGRLLAFAGGDQAKIWDTNSGRERGRWSFSPGFIDTLAFAGPEQLLLLRMETKDGKARPDGSNAQTNPRLVHIRNLLGPDPMHPLGRIEDFNWHRHEAAATSDGKIFFVEGLDQSSGQLSHKINAYEATTGKRLWSISIKRSPTHSAELRIDPTGRFLSFLADDSHKPTLVDAGSGRFLRTLSSRLQCLGPEATLSVSMAEGPQGRAEGFAVIKEDALGRLIDGDHNGTPGGNAVALLRRNGATISAAASVQSSKLQFIDPYAVDVHRVVCLIDGDTVRVLRIRRAQRQPLTRKEIDEARDKDEP